jgi:hypothetical protein
MVSIDIIHTSSIAKNVVDDRLLLMFHIDTRSALTKLSASPGSARRDHIKFLSSRPAVEMQCLN